MASDSSMSSITSSCTLPLDATIVHKYGMEFHALLTMDGPGAKKKSKITGVVFHPVRPWVAAVESKDCGVVWNYETKEVIKRFTLQIGEDVPATTVSDDTTAVATPTAVALTKSMALSTPFSPKLSSGKTKSSSVLMFFDRESIAHVSGISRGIDCFEEWLVILSSQQIAFCDINDAQSNRCITPDDLGRALPNSIEVLPGGFLAIGCSDGKIRIWSPRLWKVYHVIDTGAIKEIPHMLLVPSSTSTSSSPSTTAMLHCYLIAVHVDGKAIVWSITRVSSGDFQQSRACEFDLKDANKRGGGGASNSTANVDVTTCGYYELKLLLQDSFLTAVSKDGNVLVWDMSFLWSTTPTKEPRVTFVGLFHTLTPSTKPLHGTLLLGSSRHSYVYLSTCHTSMLNVSELHKGKATQDLEIAAHRVDLVKDVRTLHSKISKKIKLNSVSQSPRCATLLVTATNYGLLLFHLHAYTPRQSMTFLPSLASIVLNTPTHLRSVPLGDKGKKELYALKYPNKDSVGLSIKHPSAKYYVAVVTGSHYEIVHVDATGSYHTIASGPGVGVAWHSKLLRFAVLVPDEDDVAKRGRPAAMSTDSPRKKLGFFGKADEVPAATAGGPALPPFFKHDVDLRPHALAVYNVDASTGNCTRLVDKLTSGQPRHWIVHAFTGPLLGLVRCAMPDDGALKPSKATTMSTVSDSTSIVTGSSITTGEATTGMHMTLEFYEWGGDGAEDIAGKSSVSTALHKVGPTLGGPLLVEWEHSGKYAVLVYPTKCHVIKWEGHSSKLLPLHEMSTPRPVQSVLWVHHALFTATEDEIKCYFICGSRTFSFVIASTTSCFDGQEEMNQTVDLADFPAAQRHPGGPLMLLGVFQEKLLCGGIMHQSMHSVTLKHPVLQFCMFVAQGVPKRALEVVPMISADLLDWMATFLEAFGFAADALDVPGTSSHVKVSICIKHMLVHTLADLLPSLVASVATDSADMMGTSLIQRACAALCRGGQEAAVAALLPTCMQMNKWNDALVMAMLVQDRATMAQVLASNQELSHALHTSNKNADVEAQWNQQMDAHGQIRPARFAGTWM